jgi:hypothetical protein
MRKTFTYTLSTFLIIILLFAQGVYAQTNCPPPASPSVLNVTSTSVQLGWTATSQAAYFIVEYRTAGSTTWSTAIAQINPYTLGNLSCNTAYEWQVKAACPTSPGGVITMSSPSPGSPFTTLSCNTFCPAPTGLNASNLTGTSATLSWQVTGTTGLFNVQYAPAGTTTWTQVNNVQNPYQATGLTCNTYYVFQVQAICVNPNGVTTLSPWSVLYTFFSGACQNTCPAPTGLTATNLSATGAVLSWNASATIPFSFNLRYRTSGSTAWNNISNATTPYQLGNLTCGTTYEWQVQTVCLDPATGVATLSPWSTVASFTTSSCPNTCLAPGGLTATNISQTSAVLAWSAVSSTQTTFNIRYRIAGTTAWSLVNNISPPHTLSGLTCNTVYEWQVQAICSGNVPGTVQLSPWSVSHTFTTLGCTSNNCLPPTSLTATNITATGAVLSWNTTSPNPAGYNLRYRSSTSTAWTIINNATSPYQLGGLNCNTTYQWQVQTICYNSAGTVVLSPWSVTHTFTTSSCQTVCPAPTGLTTASITQNGATLSWNAVAGAGAYQIRYRVAGTVAWTYLNSGTTSIALSNLNCGVNYQWQVRALCNPASNVGLVSWSVVASFTTSGCNTTCLPPTTLTVGNITSMSATLAWNSTGAPYYRVRYRVNPNGTWSYQTTPNTSLIISGLTPLTVYEWQVQSWCTPNTNTAGSPWSVSNIFTTSQGPTTNCGVPTGLTATAVSQGGALLTWNAVTGAMAYNVRYRPLNSSANFVNATASTNMLQIGNLQPGMAYEWQVQAVCSNAPGTVTLSAWSATAVFTTPLMIVAYPNPADQVLNLSLDAMENSSVTLLLRDVFGTTVYSDVRVNSGDLTINTSALQNGWYSLTVIAGGIQNTSRVLIQR